MKWNGNFIFFQQTEISQQLMDEFNAGNIKRNIKWLAEKVHVAGTKENAELMKKIADKVRYKELL